MRFVVLVVVASLAAGCGGDDSAPEAGQSAPADSTAGADAGSESESGDAASPSSTSTSTSTSVAVTAAEPEPASDPDPEVQAFPSAPGPCLALPALLAGLPQSGLIVMTEDKIFECLGVSAFQSTVSFDGTLPTKTVAAVASSTQRLDGGAISAEAMLTENGVTTENLIRVGDDVWLRDPNGAWEASTLDLGYLFSEQGEIRLSMSGALYALSVYGGGAELVGEVELNGRTVQAWEADAANIEDYVNGLGFSPVPVGVNDGYVRIWTTADGLIVKLEGELRAADITLAGLPATQVDPASLGLPDDALDIVPDYFMSYELYGFDHDIEINAPDLG